MTQTILTTAQAVLAVLLVIAILLQTRGAGLGSAFGGEGNVYRTKRGIEKRLLQASIVLAVLFFGVAIARTLLA